MQLIDGPAIVIGPAEADGLAALLEHGRRWARDQALQPPPELAGVLAAIDALATARRRQAATEQFRSSDPGTPQDTGSVTVPLVSVGAVALRFGCSARWVRVLAQRGELPSRRVGRSFAFDPADVERYAANRKDRS